MSTTRYLRQSSTMAIALTLAACTTRPNTSTPVSATTTPAPLVRTIAPPKDTHLWINETLPVAAEISVDGGATWQQSDPQGRAVSWSANFGSYVEQFGFNTFYIAPDYYEDANVRTAILTPSIVDVLPTQPPITSAPPATQPATFDSELAAANAAANRDDHVQHLRHAIALRPNDDDNINIDFDIGILLSQRLPARTREALAVFQQIVQRYNHEKYYRSEPESSASEPALKIPRAAILAASILNGPDGDRLAARNYATIAMKDLQWTFQHRKADWQNQPKPTAPRFRFDMGDNDLENQISYWQQHKSTADAGSITLLGPYGPFLATAAVRQYALSFGPTADPSAIMATLIRDFPNTPIAVEAQKYTARTRRFSTE